jgi:hypothetical protein
VCTFRIRASFVVPIRVYEYIQYVLRDVECSLSSTMSLANDSYLFFDQCPDISEKLFLMTRDYTGAPFSNLSVAIFLRSFLNGYWGIRETNSQFSDLLRSMSIGPTKYCRFATRTPFCPEINPEADHSPTFVLH